MFSGYRQFVRYGTWARDPFFAFAKQCAAGKRVVVDMGPGDDRFARVLERTDIHFLEGNPVSREALRARYPHVYEYRAPDRLPFADASVDMVHLSHIVEHLESDALYTLLGEINRVLGVEGVLVVSAPLLHADFFNDLSHVRPYHPAVFLKYLVNGDPSCTARPLVSTKYVQEALVYRHTFTTVGSIRGFRAPMLRFFSYACHTIAVWLGWGRYERTGFTLVLRKRI